MVPGWHLDLDLDWEGMTELWGGDEGGLVGGVWIGVKKELIKQGLGLKIYEGASSGELHHVYQYQRRI